MYKIISVVLVVLLLGAGVCYSKTPLFVKNSIHEFCHKNNDSLSDMEACAIVQTQILNELYKLVDSYDYPGLTNRFRVLEVCKSTCEAGDYVCVKACFVRTIEFIQENYPAPTKK